MASRPQVTRPRLASAIAALVLGLAAAAPARADFVFTVVNSSAQAGGMGSFDVTVQNTGTAAVDVGDFQVELNLPGTTRVGFTGVSAATILPYIFSNGGPDSTPINNIITNPFPNKDFIGSASFFAAPGFQTVAAGATVGLEHVTYSVAGNVTPGTVVPVNFLKAGTRIDDVSGAPFSFTSVNGTIAIRAVPEPSSLLLCGVGGMIVFWVAAAGSRRGRRSEPTPSTARSRGA